MPLLTELEHEALELTAKLANAMRLICGTGPQADNDWNQVGQQIHALQHAIMAQAAARAYPDRYRLLGGQLDYRPPCADPDCNRRYGHDH